MHLAAGFNKPNVTIAGAREPVWFTRYPGQQYLAMDGCLPCTINSNGEPVACWYCDINRCSYPDTIIPSTSKGSSQKVPKCASIIKPEEVVNAINHYYNGGRLDKTKPSGKSKLVTVVQSNIPMAVPSAAPTAPAPKEKDLWGYAWGGACITNLDWDFIHKILMDEKVKRVLEIGSGLSTLLMKKAGIDIISFETRRADIDSLKKLDPDLDVRHWNGKDPKPFEGLDKFDLVFVDGPGGGENRGPSFEIASQLTDKILIHDAGRAPEKKWAEKYLSPRLAKFSQGGHRTAFWKLAGEKPKITIIKADPDQPTIRVVFNGRGEGGAENSTHWIMNSFMKMGWNVEYVSPNPQPSGTFRRNPIPNTLFTSNLEKIKTPCDILLLYTNDWVWEFKNLKEVFTGLRAKRKVMAVNFRLGSVGSGLTSEWTIGWDNYLFLNSSLQKAFHEKVIQANSRAMAPPADLSKYFDIQPDYNSNLRIVRHSSQGDSKYPKDFNEKLDRILTEIPDAHIYLMPAPSFLRKDLKDNHGIEDRVHCHQRNKPEVKEFLAQGNVFWYNLPEGYHDMGPKVVMESMASGLCVVADNHSGAKDRVTPETGWLCNNFEEHLQALKLLGAHPETREASGILARERAKEEFLPERWIEEIIGV
jgi:glycosyltransferase involved in cell wall biosynthesis